MVHNWMRWCRICAHEGGDSSGISSASHDTGHLLESLNNCLSKQISWDDGLPHNVCTPCEQQITSMVSFIEHASKVQAMFSELAQVAGDVDVNGIRSKFLNETEEIDQQSTQDCKENITQPLAEQMIDDIKPVLDDLMNPIKIKEELEMVDDVWVKEEEDANGFDDDKSKSSSDWEESSKEGPVKERAPYFCSECCMFYTQFHAFRNHMQMKHNRVLSPLRLPCTICNEAHATVTQLKRHMAKHVSQQRNTCQHCSEVFPTSRQLRTHVIKMHKTTKQYICECGKRCRNAITLEEHQLTHKGVVHNCRSCDKTFRTKYTLKVHEDTHSASYVCHVCGLQLNTKRTLYMHKLVHSDKKKAQVQLLRQRVQTDENLKGSPHMPHRPDALQVQLLREVLQKRGELPDAHKEFSPR